MNNYFSASYYLTSSSLPTQKKVKLPLIATKSKTPAPIFLLQICKNFQEATQFHAHFVVSGLLNHPICTRRLLQFYAANSHTHYALSIFHTITSPDVFTCNTMIRGLILGNAPYAALLLYAQLLLGYLEPDNYSYTFALKACSQLKAVAEGRQVHCRIIKTGIAPDTHVHSSLIHMYTSSGNSDCAEYVLREFLEENTIANNSMISGYLSNWQVDKARELFDKMPERDVASWSAMVTGYTKNGMHSEALALFRNMMISNSQIAPNESTLVSLLSACAHLGALHQGRWIHAYVDTIKAKMSTKLSTALIHMYAKCGDVKCGYELFRKVPQKDIVTWGAIILGFAMFGQARKCFELFEEMLAEGEYPNEVIFGALLSACSHTGYIEEGKLYFKRMIQEFGIRPCIEHYGCMVDLLGRAGQLKEAEELIISMPEQPNAVIWGAFVSACRIHKDLKRGKWAFQKLIEVEPMSGDRYKLGGLMFANVGDKEEANEIRKMIKDEEMETTCGSSFIEVDGKVHEFVVGDIIHNHSINIYGIWKGLNALVETA